GGRHRVRPLPRRFLAQRHRHSRRGRPDGRPLRRTPRFDHQHSRRNAVMTVPSVVLLDGSQPGDREILGGKAYSVNRMKGLGLPVPPAFALPTQVCGLYHGNGRVLPDEVWEAVVEAVRALESDTGRTFGTGPSPLLVSVRSGAAQSMPGMMDTVLNL